jgi:hypothetical protein
MANRVIDKMKQILHSLKEPEIMYAKVMSIPDIQNKNKNKNNNHKKKPQKT